MREFLKSRNKSVVVLKMSKKQIFKTKKAKFPKIKAPTRLVSFKIRKFTFPKLKPLKLPKVGKVKIPKCPLRESNT